MDNSLEGQKLHFEALMSEYQQLRASITNYRQLQNQLDSLALTGLGVAISLFLIVLDKNPQNISAILLFPALFYIVAFTQFRYEQSIFVAAEYIDSKLRPQLEKILSQLSKKDVNILGYEEFLSKSSWIKKLHLEWVGIMSRAVVSLAIAIGIVAIYFIIAFTSSAWVANVYDVWLLALNVLLLAIDLIVSFSIARARFRYFKKYYN